MKGDLAQFRELAAFAQFGSELDAKTQALISRGKRIVEIFNQPQYSPIPVEVEVATIWVVQNGYLDAVPLEHVKHLQKKLVDLLVTRKAELLRKIAAEKKLSDVLMSELKEAALEFGEMWKLSSDIKPMTSGGLKSA